MIWSGNSCIFDIEINAKIPFFVNLQINLIVILFPGKYLKFDQSECRLQKQTSNKKAGILRAINERTLIGCLGIEFKWTGLLMVYITEFPVFLKKNTSRFFLSEAYILPDHKEIDITMTLGYWDYVEKIKWIL